MIALTLMILIARLAPAPGGSFIARIEPCFVTSSLKISNNNSDTITQNKNEIEVQDNLINKFLKISPNPTNGIVTLVFEPNTIPKRIEIFDMLGKNVFSTETITGNEISIDISLFIKGIYMVNVIEQNRIITDIIIRE